MMHRSKLVAVLLLAIIAVGGCSGRQSAPSSDATPTPIPTPIVPSRPIYEVQQGEVVKTVQFTGRIAPEVEQPLFFRTGGYVGFVYVKRNDWVEAGDIIAELEVTDLKNQLAQAEAALESVLASNEQRVAEAEASLETAELNLAKLRVQDPGPQMVQMDIALERARTALADAQKAYQDAENRPWEWKYDHVKEAYTRALRDAELNLQGTEAQYQQVKQDQAAHYYDIQIQEQAVELARMHLEQIQSGLDIQEMQLTVQRLQAQLDDARLTAPFDGQVLSLSISEGRSVEAYRPVAVVADPSKLEISADLTDRVLTDLAEGMPVTAALVSRPDAEFSGEIRRLPYPYGGGGRQTASSTEDEDKSTRVSIDPEGATAGYEQGDLVRVTVVLERKDNVLWLPPQAIRTFEGRKFVVIQEGDAQRRVDVKVGIESEDRVEILEGLTLGQVIIGQ
ncbi:MAG: HlyD family efflux transporter periplasmic adaptor subunit [Chloroflexi bacterium]|nr:HlyD family efflux transporter periplasmic adaptor subunit [Chloroflexota bacterium]